MAKNKNNANMGKQQQTKTEFAEEMNTTTGKAGQQTKQTQNMNK